MIGQSRHLFFSSRNGRCSHPVSSTLFKCFWNKRPFNGLLAFIRLCVTYVGPVLIEQFVNYCSGERTSVYGGYYLVLELLIAKGVEVLASHQYNFQNQKLGMLVRSTIITSVYHKGLQLSNSFRQRYGMGQIVNYMAVDALQHDLDLMEYGDQTEIGERGINLSGGRKQRIQLARAVYQDCDIYLLDDVFSAVDAHTGTQLFHECILGALNGKTVLLVTHQVEFLYKADLILVMQEGMVMQSGKYAEILKSGTGLEALVLTHNIAMESISTVDQNGKGQNKDEILEFCTLEI